MQENLYKPIFIFNVDRDFLGHPDMNNRIILKMVPKNRTEPAPISAFVMIVTNLSKGEVGCRTRY
jgi:hypothetical protein